MSLGRRNDSAFESARDFSKRLSHRRLRRSVSFTAVHPESSRIDLRCGDILETTVEACCHVLEASSHGRRTGSIQGRCPWDGGDFSQDVAKMRHVLESVIGVPAPVPIAPPQGPCADPLVVDEVVAELSSPRLTRASSSSGIGMCGGYDAQATITRARLIARERGFTTISTSLPSCTRNRTSRSSEKPASRPRTSADTFG